MKSIRKEDLSSQEVTCDFNGKPLKINKIKNFPKALVNQPKVNLPNRPAVVIRDPHEIEMVLNNVDPALYEATSKFTSEGGSRDGNVKFNDTHRSLLSKVSGNKILIDT